MRGETMTVKRTGSLHAAMNRRAQLSIAAPGATPEQAAAVVAAIERHLRDTVPVLVAAPEGPSPWLQASLREGVARQPGLPSPWD